MNKVLIVDTCESDRRSGLLVKQGHAMIIAGSIRQQYKRKSSGMTRGNLKEWRLRLNPQAQKSRWSQNH